jgi:hypothetical protein
MKRRATKRVDISGSLKQLDLRGTVVVDVLVGPDGNVICAKVVHGLPMLLTGVGEAVRQWTFRPVNENNVPVAYVGRLDFTLCNIGCGKEGSSMSLLKLEEDLRRPAKAELLECRHSTANR